MDKKKKSKDNSKNILGHLAGSACKFDLGVVSSSLMLNAEITYKNGKSLKKNTLSQTKMETNTKTYEMRLKQF